VINVIKNRFSGHVIARIEAPDRNAAVVKAIQEGVDLSCADLRWLSLKEQNIRGAKLRKANLENVEFRAVDMRGADVEGAKFDGADLRETDMREIKAGNASFHRVDLRNAKIDDAYFGNVDLTDAYLRETSARNTNFRGAKVGRANVLNADFSGANLGDANMNGIKRDLWRVLSQAPNEINGLRQALLEGRIDGDAYRGECASLIGTIANVRGCDLNEVGISPSPNRPAELWFLAIEPGDTPSSSPIAEMTLRWIDEFRTRQYLVK
jgi:hypothetical protein